MRVRVGALFPLFGPASGRVLLAFDDDEAIRDYIARNEPLRNPRTGELVDPALLLAEVEKIRREGQARVVRASAPQMVSVGFPVWDLDNRLHGSISVGGPRERFAAQLEDQMPELIEIVADLNRRSRLFPADDAGSELN